MHRDGGNEDRWKKDAGRKHCLMETNIARELLREEPYQ